MKSKYKKSMWFSYMYGESEDTLWCRYGRLIGRRRFNLYMREFLKDFHNLYMG